MMTAYANLKTAVKAFKLGAFDYLIKPFDEKELMVRIKNLISIREKLQIKYEHTLFP